MVLESDVAGPWQVFEGRFEFVLTAVRVLLGSCPSVEICRDDFLVVQCDLYFWTFAANLNLVPFAHWLDRVGTRHYRVVECPAIVRSYGVFSVRVQKLNLESTLNGILWVAPDENPTVAITAQLELEL